jgi:hypothetical protein
MGILKVATNKRRKTTNMPPFGGGGGGDNNDASMMMSSTSPALFMIVENLDVCATDDDDFGSIEVETFSKPGSGQVLVKRILVAPEKAPLEEQEKENRVEAVASQDGTNTTMLIESDDKSAAQDFYETITNALLWNPCGMLQDEEPPKIKSALKRGPSCTKRNVSFQGLEIREYDLTLGDHPSASTGPPIQLDWEYKSQHKIDNLEEYEKARSPRRNRKQLRMPYQERERILFDEKKFSETEVLNAWNEAVKVRKQRYETFTQSLASTKMEEAWESACRKFTRTFGVADY